MARARWCVLDTGFGSGRAFLEALDAWRTGAQRPGSLHWVGILPTPVAPLQAPLAEIATGLTPGFHRIPFEDGRVLLTLCVGEVAAVLRELDFRADAIRLAGDTAPDTIRAVARLCRRGTRLTTDATGLDTALQVAGFRTDAAGTVYDPTWAMKGLPTAAEVPPGRAVVIGAGLAGAAVSASLARRGWQVQVLDAAAAPAAGASGLPAGLLAPHQSPDDNVLSQLSRAGIRITLAEAQARLTAGRDWALTGVLEHRLDDGRPVPAVDGLMPWTRQAGDAEKAAAKLAGDAPAWWHAQAGWVVPAALVHAWLAEPGVAFRGGVRVASVRRDDAAWTVVDEDGVPCANADLVVVAMAHASATLLQGRIATHPVRGQVSWAPAGAADPLAPFPVNGHGHFLPRVPLPKGMAWLSGSTYGRADPDPLPRAGDQAANLERLRLLLPAAAEALAPRFEAGSVNAWSGVRCASSDRRPLVGELEPGLWVSTAMGSRGLTFAALCAELLAAWLHGEPLPLPLRLAKALEAGRQGRG